jgi:release factor glutamine methyltransferase
MPTTAFHNVSLLAAPGQVMAPRHATERLVDRALELLEARPARIADVGTGSGAIAVTLALLAPQAEIWATDVSVPAAELAAANAERHRISERVHVLVGDLLEPIPGGFDLVLANLPYLPRGARGEVRYDDLAGEPADAVFSLGDGLGPYRRLLGSARDRLLPEGRILLQYRAGLFEAGWVELPSLLRDLEDAALAA